MERSLNTIGKLFLNRCEISSFKNSIGWIEDQQVLFYSYKQYKNAVSATALSLKKLGLQVQSKVAILSNSNKEWHVIDMACMVSGAVVIPIYHTFPPSEISYILQHSEAEFLFVENLETYKRIQPILSQVKTLKNIICIQSSTENSNQIIPYQNLLNTGYELLNEQLISFEKSILKIDPDSIASIIYTSGTTGEPKGAIITQVAFTQMLKNVKEFVKGAFQENDRSLVYLPLSHVFGRCDSLLHLIFGCETVFAESPEKLMENIKLVKPTFMLSVPRIFEKIYDRINLKISEMDVISKNLFKLATTAVNNYYEKLDNDIAPSSFEKIQYQIAYEKFFKKIYNEFGGKIRFFVSGGAPLSEEIIKFLRNANLPILEGYGLTETIGPVVVNPVSRQIPGTTGQPIGDVQISFGKDNEILIKTKAMFSGYYKDQESTDKSIIDGWFYTGDIGSLNNYGYLKITDRKKDILITSGGKNIAPQKIEGLLKLQRHISHCAIIGDKRPYLTALIAIEKESFLNNMSEFGIDLDTSIDQLAHNPKIRAIIRDEIEVVNQSLANFETIKKFYILPINVTMSNYLTPSLKLKKKSLVTDYQKEIDAMYN